LLFFSFTKVSLSHLCFLQNFFLTPRVALGVLRVSVAQGQKVLRDTVLLPLCLLPSEKRRGARSEGTCAAVGGWQGLFWDKTITTQQ